MGNAIGAGNVISTASDLLRWNHYLHHETSLEFRQIILKNYCQDEDHDWINLGLSTTPETICGTLIGFQGAQDSYNSFLGYYPEYHLNIAILSNASKKFEEIMEKLEKIMNVFRVCQEFQLVQENSIEPEENLFFSYKSLVALGIDIPLSKKDHTPSYLSTMKSKTPAGRHWEI